MKDLNRLLYILGYILFVGPPRALDLAVSERKRGGELARVPVWGVLLVEGLFRLVLLLSVAVFFEQLITPYWYSWLEIDRSAMIMLLIGSLHMISYYLLLHRFYKKLGSRTFRIYRLLRNIGYAFLPGLAAVTLALLYDAQQVTPVVDLQIQSMIYAGVTIVMLAAGIGEAILVSRTPQGLDSYLRRRAQV